MVGDICLSDLSVLNKVLESAGAGTNKLEIHCDDFLSALTDRDFHKQVM